MKTYNKLIRDKIPGILTAAGKNYRTHIAGDEEYTQKLKEKLLEEVNEFLSVPSLEELGDILEVFTAIVEDMGFSQEELIEQVQYKTESNGDFTHRIILDAVDE